ncbi:MAG: glycosylhydrolase-like jelly roll fold domain-containing protein [Pirellulales bacterium]
MHLPPDFEADALIRYAHRRTEEREIYFVANRQPQPVAARCVFRVTGRRPELWDPVRGTVRPLPDFAQQDGRTTIPLRFEPHQSFFVVFPKDTAAVPKATGTRVNFRKLVTVGQIDGPWKVTFDTTAGGPPATTFTTLDDWSRRPEAAIKYYAGIATYHRTFDLPPSLQGRAGRTMVLDLGQVHELARVRLNGSDLGIVWCAPWRVDITRALQQGKNQLEIDVANLWPNRLIGDKSVPPERRVTRTNFNPYRPDAPLLPSGLLGPVTLMATEGPLATPARKGP